MIARDNYAQLVDAMRQAQKDFFANHTQTALNRAKDLEKRVDTATLTILANAPQQTGFFDVAPAPANKLLNAARMLADARAHGNMTDFWRAVGMVEAAIGAPVVAMEEEPCTH